MEIGNTEWTRKYLSLYPTAISFPISYLQTYINITKLIIIIIPFLTWHYRLQHIVDNILVLMEKLRRI